MDEAQHFLDSRIILRPGDCRDILKELDDSSIDAVITDPPYALVSIVKRFGADGSAPATPKEGAAGAYARASAGFMGKKWDTGETAFAADFWREVLRVLKPGGHVAAFSGTRTYHRMAVAIEDAGFEIRDQVAWCYGTGFPKSHNISKAIDKHLGIKAQVVGREVLTNDMRNSALLKAAKGQSRPPNERDIVVATSAEAREWDGWGTALKPAWEPICIARKPISEKSVAANVLKWGLGAINIRACRVAAEKTTGWGGKAAGGGTWNDTNCGLVTDGSPRPVDGRYPANIVTDGSPEVMDGRYPANIVTDGSPEVMAAFPEAPGQQQPVGPQHGERARQNVYGALGPRGEHPPILDTGSAARFFYSAKADADDRLLSKHPTVKPVDLMRWLVRLLCPKGGVVLDPFAGTGPTGAAAYWEGCSAILIEREKEYQSDIARRMGLVLAGPEERKRAITEPASVSDLPLFGDESDAAGEATAVSTSADC